MKMKKILFIAICVFTLTVSCKQAEVTNDATETIDTVIVTTDTLNVTVDSTETEVKN